FPDGTLATRRARQATGGLMLFSDTDVPALLPTVPWIAKLGACGSKRTSGDLRSFAQVDGLYGTESAADAIQAAAC
ncbi:MAG: hypothetical protein ACSLFH_01990, partial [Desulfuromonadales bacterium]